MDIQDNPSFYVLTIPRPGSVEPINIYLASQFEDEDGSVLTPIGDKQYVLCRSAALQLKQANQTRDLTQFLEAIAGVSRVQRMRGDALCEAMQALPSLPSRETESTPEIADALPWHVKRVRAPQAWQLIAGGLEERRWRRIRVGLMDTGYTEHAVFGPWISGRSPTIRGQDGVNYLEEGELPIDNLTYRGNPGHGTRVASVLGGHLPDVFHGVAPGVSIVPYRVTNSVVIDTSSNRGGNRIRLAEAIRDAVENQGCHIISISLGEPCLPGTDLGRAIDEAYEAGGIVVAAAGNVSKTVVFPAQYARTIGVAGVTQRDRPWRNSSRGPRVDLSAPADNIHRADVRLKRRNQPSYSFAKSGDGTSYAVAHVAGAAALWLHHHADALDRYPHRWQRVEAFRRVITAERNVFPFGGGYVYENLFGAGILNIEAVLQANVPDPDSLVKESRLARDDRATDPPSDSPGWARR